MFKQCKSSICMLSLITTSTIFAAPITTIKLQGNFYEMGQAYSEQLGDVLVNQLALIKKELTPADPVKRAQYERALPQFIQIAKSRYPAPLYDFLKGEAQSTYAKTHGLSIEDFVYMDNLMFFIKFSESFKNKVNESQSACSFIGVRKEAPVIGRNFDFPRDYINVMTTYPIVMQLNHSDKEHYPNKVTAISFPGGLSAASFMNDKGHFIAINAGTNVLSDKEFKVFQRQSYVNQMLLAMMSLADFQALQSWAQTTAPDYSYIVNMAGPKFEELVSVESSAYNVLEGQYPPNTIPDTVFKVRQRLPNSTEVTFPTTDTNADLLVATNSFHLSNWEPFIGHSIEYVPYQYSFERYNNLIQLGRDRHYSNMSEVKGIMERELNTTTYRQGATVNYCGLDTIYEKEDSATYYSLVFDTQTRTVALRIQQEAKEDETGCYSRWSDWVEFLV